MLLSILTSKHFSITFNIFHTVEKIWHNANTAKIRPSLSTGARRAVILSEEYKRAAMILNKLQGSLDEIEPVQKQPPISM